jgi:hypothetical protein
MMEKCMPAKSRICKCYMVYERDISRAKRLSRIIKSLGYKASEAAV